jgi:hypothetical protein
VNHGKIAAVHIDLVRSRSVYKDIDQEAICREKGLMLNGMLAK